ncbi:MAG: glycosyltransferase family 2 protein [Arcobacteraceae bacterium]|nr:glycosyltransferase family 2 protein [Arcobacteraceae bacterium]
MIKNITPVIIAKDAQKTIKETLDSLVDFNEVVLYINNSTDNTETIAREYLNVKIVDGDFSGFGPTKNQASSYASNDWILSLDSDEVILPQLLLELKEINLENTKEVFVIKRDNYFLGKEVKYSGWGKDYLVRLYNKNSHQFNQNMVHEFIEITKNTQKTTLNNSFKHNAVDDINQFLIKIIKYSDLASKDKKTCYFLVVLAKAKWAFLKTYFLQLGFLDGWRGFVIAMSNFNGKFFRYTKRYINCKKI